MPTSQLGRIEHVVVLMLENRSFDNVLGWLYDPANSAPFNPTPPANFAGVYGKSLSNPTPDGQSIDVAKGNDPASPFPDPGEVFQDVYAQIYGQKTTLYANAVVGEPPRACNMQGFVYNYALKNQANLGNAATIMNCFTPAVVPVISSLAYYYGLCDHWFASIPSQTLCNRSFVQAGTSSGYVNNDGGDGLLFINDTPTIFNLLSDAHKSWKVYCGGWSITSLVLLTQMQVWDFALRPGYFEHVSDFVEDAQQPGGLPAYSFIEPNYFDSIVYGPENDMHPESHAFQLFGRSNVEQGEKLIYDVYTAVRNSPDWDKILLLIVFDEHGGCYDHVCPPTSKDCPFAISPDGVVIPPDRPGGTGFTFDRLGVRVPAIVISAYTPQGTILNRIFDHTSALSTVVNCFELPAGKLGKRQAAAPDVSEGLTLTDPRQDQPAIPLPGAESIRVTMRAAAVGTAIVHAQSKPLSELQKRILVGSAKRLGLSQTQQQEIANAQTSLAADAELLKFEAQLAVKRAVRHF
ncbi:MAG: alkaline phosphatase family protein [Candidatus Acidiferrum sp.]